MTSNEVKKNLDQYFGKLHLGDITFIPHKSVGVS